jgi:methionyl-tRNA formyltransferase
VSLTRIVYLGTPEFAVPTLERVVAAGYDVCAVFTQPDRAKGRGQELAPSPVKQAALRLGLAVHQPERVRRPEVIQLLADQKADAMVIVGYGHIIPQSIIDLAPYGIINVHASLLPKYRGAAPIQWAIARGETRTGVTTMRIDAGLDTGDILVMAETAIGAEETAPELSARLAQMGADLLVETLGGLVAGSITPRKQDHAAATLAPILKKEDGLVNWRMTAGEIACRVRGFMPWPGSYTGFQGQTLRIWKARAAESFTCPAPGVIAVSGRRLLVGCGEQTALELLELQLEGRKRVPAAAFLNGQRLKEHELLGELP